MKKYLSSQEIHEQAVKGQNTARLRIDERNAVYKKYGYYEKTKLAIDSKGMRRFLLDEGFTYDALKDFLVKRQKAYYRGISQVLMYQALVGKPWTTAVLSNDEVEEALKVVFPKESVADLAIRTVRTKTLKEVVHTEVIPEREQMLRQLRLYFADAHQCARYIARIAPLAWRDDELMPGVTMRKAVDTVVLEGKHVTRPSKHNVGIDSLKKLLDTTWDLPPTPKEELHILEKAIGEMIYNKIKKIAPDPVAFCNRFLGGRCSNIAGYPFLTAANYMQISKWDIDSTHSTMQIMLDIWRFDKVAGTIQQYRTIPSTLAFDLQRKQPPATLLSDNALRCILGIKIKYTRDPVELKKKIDETLGIAR